MEMIKSMTGYGRAVQTVNGREFTVEDVPFKETYFGEK